MKLKLRAGVLSFTLYVSILVSVFLLAMILYGYYSRLDSARYRMGLRVLDNLASAEQWALGEGRNLDYGERKIWDLFGDGRDSVSVHRFAWGAFEGYKCGAYYQGLNERSIFLAGRKMTEEGNAALYLVDDGRPLSVVGETRITGTTYLPLAGVKSAFINRLGYTGEKLIFGDIKQSKKQLPELETFDTLDEFEDFADDIPSVEVEPEGHFRQPFSADTLLKMAGRNITIVDSLAGFIWVDSRGKVTFDSTSVVEDIVVTAREIEFYSGFSGSGQFFASDTIRVHGGVSFSYPTILGVQNRIETAYIEIMENADVHAIIILDGSSYGDRSRVLKIEDKAKVSGKIYCNGYLEGFGEVDAHVMVKRFLINSFSGVYENYILNATYDNTLDSTYLMPDSWFQSEQNEVVKWLH